MNTTSELAEELGFSLSSSELLEYAQIMDNGPKEGVSIVIKESTSYKHVATWERTEFIRPSPEENKFNAWFVKGTIKGSSKGKLLGKKIAIKDSVGVKGVLMSNGSKILSGYVCDTDAVIIERILEQGGTIVGKTCCEDLCLSGGSHTNVYGAVLNPNNTKFTCGGSSSGSAVVVKTGEVDMAIGGDQGGSIRIPSCWTGCCGIKPTFGLVPMTGCMGIEYTLDHLGPITSNVYDSALLLEVIAGADGLDKRQNIPHGVTFNYTEELTNECSISGMKIGVVIEGFDRNNEKCTEVNQNVDKALEIFERLGCIVDQVSIPAHKDAPGLFSPIISTGFVHQFLLGNGFGTGQQGITPSLQEAIVKGLKSHASELSPTVKYTAMVGSHILKHGGQAYFKAQQERLGLEFCYDKQLDNYDLLVMPTIKFLANELPKDTNLSIADTIKMAFNMIDNTAPFNMTGHPAMNVPCGASKDNLPTGIMLVAKKWEEKKLLKAAYCFERAFKSEI